MGRRQGVPTAWRASKTSWSIGSPVDVALAACRRELGDRGGNFISGILRAAPAHAVSASRWRGGRVAAARRGGWQHTERGGDQDVVCTLMGKPRESGGPGRRVLTSGSASFRHSGLGAQGPGAGPPPAFRQSKPDWFGGPSRGVGAESLAGRSPEWGGCGRARKAYTAATLRSDPCQCLWAGSRGEWGLACCVWRPLPVLCALQCLPDAAIYLREGVYDCHLRRHQPEAPQAYHPLASTCSRAHPRPGML